MGKLKRWVATRLRYLADRIDWEGAPKRTNWTFKFVQGKGIVFEFSGKGCPVWYYGNEDYERAHSE